MLGHVWIHSVPLEMPFLKLVFNFNCQLLVMADFRSSTLLTYCFLARRYIFKPMNIASVFEFSRLENIWLFLFYFNTWFLFSIIKIQTYRVYNLIIQTMICSDLIKQWNVNKLICFKSGPVKQINSEDSHSI